MELLLIIPVVAVTAFVTSKIARRRSSSTQSLPADAARFEELERTVERLQQELAETQERLDFTERLLTTAREERRLGS
jgi:predicted  nucleic acid-binding Zn-ribbon protein